MQSRKNNRIFLDDFVRGGGGVRWQTLATKAFLIVQKMIGNIICTIAIFDFTVYIIYAEIIKTRF